MKPFRGFVPKHLTSSFRPFQRSCQSVTTSSELCAPCRVDHTANVGDIMISVPGQLQQTSNLYFPPLHFPSSCIFSGTAVVDPQINNTSFCQNCLLRKYSPRNNFLSLCFLEEQKGDNLTSLNSKCQCLLLACSSNKSEKTFMVTDHSSSACAQAKIYCSDMNGDTTANAEDTEKSTDSDDAGEDSDQDKADPSLEVLISPSVSSLKTVKVVPGKGAPPEPPVDCCMSGCANCVWILYAEELKNYYSDSGEAAREAIEKIENPSLKAFLKLELGF